MILKYSLVICLACCLNGYTCAESKKEDVPEQVETCLDHKGKVVSHGDRFFPLGSDPCTQCTCSNGKPEMCISVFCSPPENCRQYHALSDKCCEFVCLDRDFPNKGSGNGSYPDADSLSPTNLGLRLAASTVATFLILALLMFMVHRLRQRRLLRMIRRCRAGQMDNGTAHLSRRYSEDDDGSVGYFSGHDHLDFSRYDEPPPPYSLWKPPEVYIPPGEAPPPYDLSVQLTAPFSGGGSYNFEAHSRAFSQHQHLADPGHRQNETRMAAMQSVPPAFSVIAATSQADQSHALCHSSVTCHNSNYQSCSSTNNNITVINCNREVVPPPPPPPHQPPVEQLAAETSGTAAEVTVIVNEVPVSTSENVASCSINSEASTSAAVPEVTEPSIDTSCTCNVIATKPALYNKRHSSGEYSKQSWLKSARNRRDKRLSVASSAHSQSSSLYPDPTLWNVEPSESSSSSSPTYEQPTPSPSTSDSSFADAEFSHNSKSELDKSGASCQVISPSNDRLSPTDTFPMHHGRSAPDDDNKTPTLQKTLSHFKKFSLMKRRKKRKPEERSAEISCSIVCQSMPDAVLSPQPLASSDGASTSKSTDYLCGRPLEAINPHIGHKLASSGVRKGARPTSISISSHMLRHVPNEEGGHSSFYSSLYGIDNHFTTSHMIAIHSRPRSKSSRRAQTLEGCSCSSVQRGASEGASNKPNQSPSNRSVCGISRSGSICSETGERRYHKSPTSSLSPGMSQSMQSTEEKDVQAKHSQERVSLVSVPNESRNHEASTSSKRSVNNYSRTLPVWIVNSESALPKHDFQLHRSSSGILSRCFSAGQISESSQDSSYGSSLHPALRITDPSMCDSNWEACSHL